MSATSQPTARSRPCASAAKGRVTSPGAAPGLGACRLKIAKLACRRHSATEPRPPQPPPPLPRSQDRDFLRLAPGLPPPRQTPAVRADTPLLPPPPGPPPPSAIRIIRSWTQVVRGESVGSVPGPSFSVPFSGLAVESQPGAQLGPRVDPMDEHECCFMEASAELAKMEADLARAVVVTVTGARPNVDLASAAEALHAEFGIGPNDISIRAFYPEDFLVICEHPITRQLMVDRGHAASSWFELSIRPWLRQGQATAARLPFLVPLKLVRVPGHAWTKRTAEVVLRGLGFVESVAERTAARFDMSGFMVWLRTADPSKITANRRLFIEEPRNGRRGSASEAQSAL